MPPPEQRQGHEAIRRQAYGQIGQDREQLALLGDRVRHPLQVITVRADLMPDGEAAPSIRQQVQRINGIIRQPDRGRIESRAIRECFRRTDLA